MNMHPAKLILIGGLRLTLPSDGILTREQPRSRCSTYILKGPLASHFLNGLEASARARGYFAVDRGPDALRISWREKFVAAEMADKYCVKISVHDPDQWPFSKVTASGVAIGPIAIPLPGVRIVPRREWCDEQKAEWVGEWEIEGRDPEQLSGMVLEALAALGLRAVGPFMPKDAGLGDVWSSEAYDRHRLVKVMVVPRTYHVQLTVEVYDSTLATPSERSDGLRGSSGDQGDVTGA